MVGIRLPNAGGHGISCFVENWGYPKAALGEYLERHVLQAEYATYEEDADPALLGLQEPEASPFDGGGTGGFDSATGSILPQQEFAGEGASGENATGAESETPASPAPELSALDNIPPLAPHEGSWVISNREPGITGAASAGRHPRNSSNDTNFVTPITPICASLHSLPDEERERNRFGNKIRRDFAVELKSLTADEARYLSNFRDADALRGAIAKARLGRENRLHAKVLEQEVGCELTRSSSSASVSGSGRHRPTIEGSATGATSKPAMDIPGSVTRTLRRYGRPQGGCRVAQ